MFCLSFISSLAKAKLSFPCVGAPIIFIGHISEVPCFNIISSAIRQQASTMDWCIAAFLLFSPMLFWRCLHCVRCHSTIAQEDWTRRIQIRCSLGGNVTMFWPVRDMAVIKIYFVLQFFLVTTPPVAVAFWRVALRKIQGERTRRLYLTRVQNQSCETCKNSTVSLSEASKHCSTTGTQFAKTILCRHFTVL